MIKYDIIIPMHNQGDLTAACLQSIKEHSQDYRVILIDNASTLEHFSKITSILVSLANHTLITNHENLGFVKATNQGIKSSTAPYVVLLNNDTKVVPGWLEALEKGFSISNSVGVVGPLSTSKLQWQGRVEPKEIGEEYRLLRGFNMLSFFCCMLKREVIERIGLLDEDFGVGFGDDDNYCHRMNFFGYHSCLCLTVCINHHHRTTFKSLYSQDDIEQMQKEALELVTIKDEEMISGN